ncbi:dephospho-CoA kinase [Fusobacterium gonidiaformans 3-1-5R]|uniref:Dephospho-CoA kinase n=2 Tax=Fusobacterium TaxID=848 RepID=E5BH20_9FUSO|nr:MULTISPECIES: dephospho-CoA kinase [Fusobacterium]AVQ16883.1 dephospho-CoA kinase [Fusobacterium gonidiaformans ATCC 25563]EFS21793.1 dephospho-CoA kinase [Fusobacterium gonidiaformans 3-1-5R]EFS28467.1 dephospho-CoA kinase [Fusobacterium gonidiaformans ATCC 25563]KXA13178.1 dephospho-CoA kinase [Fusobacterium equinum]
MIIGITGTIASGKSTVSDYFIKQGYVVIDADKITKELQEQKEVLKEFLEIFGESVLLENRSLNRQKLREIVFQDKTALQKINRIMHPKVREKFEDVRSRTLKEEIVFFDIPLLFEAHFEDLCEKIILVCAEREVQIRRVIQRDNSSRELAEKIINSQAKEEEKRKKSDYIIENNGTVEELYQKLKKWEETFNENCRSSRK